MEERRHLRWVDGKVQWPFTVTILIVMTFSALAGATVAYCIGVILSSPTGSTGALALLPHQTINVLSISFLMVGFTALMLSYGILASHRIAGPLVSIRQTLRKIREEGNPRRPFSIRKDDWLHELVDELNSTFAQLSRKVEQQEQRIRELSGKKLELEQMVARQDTKSLELPSSRT